MIGMIFMIFSFFWSIFSDFSDYSDFFLTKLSEKSHHVNLDGKKVSWKWRKPQGNLCPIFLRIFKNLQKNEAPGSPAAKATFFSGERDRGTGRARRKWRKPQGNLCPIFLRIFQYLQEHEAQAVQRQRSFLLISAGTSGPGCPATKAISSLGERDRGTGRTRSKWRKPQGNLCPIFLRIYKYLLKNQVQVFPRV